LQGIQLGKQRDLQTQQAERQLAMQEGELQRQQAEQARRQQIIAGMPAEQRALVEAASALPSGAFDRLYPKPQEAGRPFGSDALGYFSMGPDGKPQQLVPGLGRAGTSTPTALERNVPFVAEALGIPQGEAAQMLLSSASGRATPEQIKGDFAKSYANNNFGATAEQATAFAEDMYGRIYGGGPPAPMVEAPPSAEQQFSWHNPSTWFGGGEEAAPTALAQNPLRQAAQQAQAPDLPMMAGSTTAPDPAKLGAGTAYRLPNGEVAVWNGETFAVQ
jgi:hypothetical protein